MVDYQKQDKQSYDSLTLEYKNSIQNSIHFWPVIGFHTKMTEWEEKSFERWKIQKQKWRTWLYLWYLNWIDSRYYQQLTAPVTNK